MGFLIAGDAVICHPQTAYTIKPRQPAGYMLGKPTSTQAERQVGRTMRANAARAALDAPR